MGVQVAFNLNVLPIKAFSNIIDNFSIYAKFYSQLRLQSSIWSLQSFFNNQSSFLCQFRLSLVTTNSNWREAKSTFCDTVLRIISIRTQKQMVGVYTFRIIAFMANQQTFRNRAFMKSVRKPMRLYFFSRSTATSHLPVTFSIETSCPQPAVFRFFNFIPESIFNWNGLSHIDNMTEVNAFVKEIA